jgi:hypothetical protein
VKEWWKTFLLRAHSICYRTPPIYLPYADPQPPLCNIEKSRIRDSLEFTKLRQGLLIGNVLHVAGIVTLKSFSERKVCGKARLCCSLVVAMWDLSVSAKEVIKWPIAGLPDSVVSTPQP